MKVLGILAIGLVAALAAAAQQLASGAGLWAAVLAYLSVGFVATLLGAGLVMLRAADALRPAGKPVMPGVIPGAAD